MRDRGWSFSSLAPYAIFPLPPDHVADLLLGFVDLAMSLHLRLLEESLSRGEIKVDVARPPSTEALFLEAFRRDVGVRVPAHLREQMMVELMTPDALYAELDHVLTLNEQRSDETLDSRVVVFEDETAVWERPRDTDGG
jgi:hypothetical protein